VQDLVAVCGQLLRRRLDGVSVGDVELEADLRDGPILGVARGGGCGEREPTPPPGALDARTPRLRSCWRTAARKYAAAVNGFEVFFRLNLR
jgi:hypothetical protein